MVYGCSFNSTAVCSHNYYSSYFLYVASEVPQSDPRWIACWWLGFIIVAFIEIICAIPMFQFPRHMANSEHRNEDTEEDANTSLIINNTNKHSLKVAIKDDITCNYNKLFLKIN